MCVNFGRRGAVKVLQQCLNSKNRNKIEVDGGIGVQILMTLKRVNSKHFIG